MNQIGIQLTPALLTPEIELKPAADELRAALARDNRQRQDIAEESGVSAPLVTALLNGTEKAKRMNLHNIALIAAACGYRVRLLVEPLGEDVASEQAA